MNDIANNTNSGKKIISRIISLADKEGGVKNEKIYTEDINYSCYIDVFSSK